jgi:alanyl-tRNA synthetase
MVSERLYYHDSYTTTFTAEGVEQWEVEGKTAVILTHSLFYPTSGGQPHDTGTLNGIDVLDVFIRKEDEAVVHLLSAPLIDNTVNGHIHWPRRFDHMQQHSGQHILSQAFIQTANAHTVSFHLSDDSVTIDLDQENLSDDQITAAEQLANDIVWQDRPIHVREVTLEEAQQLNLRKLPPIESGKIRLVDIEDFDLTACGGTHVNRTGGVGLIKIVKLERRRQKLRVEFRCGGRALADYAAKNSVALDLGNELTTSLEDLLPAVLRLRDQLKEVNRQLKQQETALMALQAQQLLATAERVNGTAVITHLLDPNANLSVLANQLLEGGETAVCLLGSAGERSQLLFCRTPDTSGHMGQLIKQALAQLGGNGGGRPDRAQGGGPAATPDQVAHVLALAKKEIIGHS